ncbi:MAG: transporter [Gammaproteobacteria bacterium]|nr:transporter [Gammaproteobacteria bacterium]
MRINKLFISASALAGSLFSSTMVTAAGLWLYEAATPEMGTASAGRNATADSASTASFNPAGMTRLERDELMLGIQPMYIKARFDIDNGSGSGGGDGGNAGGWVPVASLNYVHELSPDLKLGITNGSYLGLGLDYGSDWGGRYFVTEAEFLTFMTAVNLGYKVNDKLSIGGGVNIVYSSLTQKMEWNNPGAIPDSLIKIDDSDIGYGFNLGLLYEFSPSTRVGLTYLSEVEFEFEDAIDTSSMVGIAGHILADAKINLEMSLPQAVSLSIFHQLDEKWALLASAGWQEWSEFGKTDLKFAQLGSFTDDRNFDDTWSLGVGFHYQLSEPWKLMAGVTYDSSPVDDKDRTIDMPLDRQIRYAFGASYLYNSDITISAAYELMDAGKAKVDQSGLARQGTLNGEFEKNYIHIFNVNASWKF